MIEPTPIRRYMSSPVFTVNQRTPLREVDALLELHGVSALAVEDDSGRTAGVVSRTDLLRVGRVERHPASRTLVLPDGPVADAMQRDVVALGPDEPLERASRLMVKRHIHRVFVAEREDLLGVLSTTDLMRAVVDARLDTPIGELATKAIVSIGARESLGLAAVRLALAHKHALVVIDQGWPVGTLGDEELLLAREWPVQTPVEEWMNVRVLSLPMGMPAHRAAAAALAMNVRHVLAMDELGLRGIVTGIDFARAWH